MPRPRNTRADAISAASIRRLSLYLRHLESLDRRGVAPTISSRAIGAALGFTDAQVRKDLTQFGSFGSPGVGYRVVDLTRQLRQVIGTDRAWEAILVGVGNLGRALASHGGFVAKGFRIVGLFDADPTKVGQLVGVGQPPEAIVVASMDAAAAFAASRGVRLAILAVPPDTAQAVAETLVTAGIDGILNFAPVRLELPARVVVNSVDLAAQLERIVFQLQPSP